MGMALGINYSDAASTSTYRNDEENEKLNTLIDDYRRENERCT